MEASELDSMNNLLKGEISAVESYERALEKVKDSKFAEIIQQARDSHVERVEKLREAIIKSGGEPIETSGAWGGFAKFVTGAAAAMGDAAIISALEEGEDVGSNEYEWKMLNIHGDNRTLIRDVLWPKQQATHKLMSKLAAEYTAIKVPVPETRNG
jgi:uncharacterized protein (TIGR02284 family)